MKRTTLLLILILALTACSGGESGEAVNAANAQQEQQQQQVEENATPEPALPLNDAGEQIVASVNGVDITLAQFDRAMNRSQQVVSAETYDAVATYELDILIEQALINQAAESLDVAVSEDEVEDEYARIRQNAGDAWNDWLGENNFTEDELRQFLYNTLLTQRMIDSVTQLENETVPAVNARHIVVETEAEADALLAQLQEGADFAQLAAEHSKDVTSRENGGDLGWFTADTLLTPELWEAAFRLQPNEITGPVETALGYHIIQTLAIGEQEVVPEAEAEEAAAQFAEWLQTQRDAATIERYVDF